MSYVLGFHSFEELFRYAFYDPFDPQREKTLRDKANELLRKVDYIVKDLEDFLASNQGAVVVHELENIDKSKTDSIGVIGGIDAPYSAKFKQFINNHPDAKEAIEASGGLSYFAHEHGFFFMPMTNEATNQCQTVLSSSKIYVDAEAVPELPVVDARSPSSVVALVIPEEISMPLTRTVEASPATEIGNWNVEHTDEDSILERCYQVAERNMGIEPRSLTNLRAPPMTVDREVANLVRQQAMQASMALFWQRRLQPIIEDHQRLVLSSILRVTPKVASNKAAIVAHRRVQISNKTFLQDLAELAGKGLQMILKKKK
jgi:hypothetical protein